MKQLLIFFLFFTPTLSFSKAVALKDNILFAFEKCKSLSVDLHKGQLKEAVVSSFDVHCRQIPDKPLEQRCGFFEPGSQKESSHSTFTGGSELGEGKLEDQKGRIIRFLIGKGYASFEDPSQHKACIGIFIFEKEALKKKSAP